MSDQMMWLNEPLSYFIKKAGDGGTPSRSDESNFGEDIPWVVITDIQREIHDTKEKLSIKGLNSCTSKLWPKKSIILSTGATIGKVGIAEVELATKQGITGIVTNGRVIPDYLYYVLLHKKNNLIAWSQGSTFKEIRVPILSKVPVKVPVNKKIQEQISTILETIDHTIEKTLTLIHKYQQIKAGLMHDLFTRGVTVDGKLRPPREQAPELYKKSPIGWIPKEWAYGLLNEIVNPSRPIVYGILMPGYGFDGGIPVVKVKDINDRKIRMDNLLLTSPSIDNEYRRSKLKPGDILLTIRGTVGRICIVPEELNGANITQDTARIDLSDGNNNFYSYYFETDAAIRHFSINTLGVAVQGINLGEVRKTPIPKPSINEQFEIAKRVANINNKIDRQKETYKKLQFIKSGLMHDLLTGKAQVKLDQEESAHV